MNRNKCVSHTFFTAKCRNNQRDILSPQLDRWSAYQARVGAGNLGGWLFFVLVGFLGEAALLDDVLVLKDGTGSRREGLETATESHG